MVMGSLLAGAVRLQSFVMRLKLADQLHDGRQGRERPVKNESAMFACAYLLGIRKVVNREWDGAQGKVMGILGKGVVEERRRRC